MAYLSNAEIHMTSVTRLGYFFKKWTIPGLFFFIFVFSIQLTVEFNINVLPMIGFKPRTSGIERTALPTKPQPLWKISLTIFHSEVAQISGAFWRCLGKCHCKNKNCDRCFWDTFWKKWAAVYSSIWSHYTRRPKSNFLFLCVVNWEIFHLKNHLFERANIKGDQRDKWPVIKINYFHKVPL